MTITWALAALAWAILAGLPKAGADGELVWIYGIVLLIGVAIIIGPVMSQGFDAIEAAMIVGGIAAALVLLLFLVGLWRREPILVGIAGHAAITAVGFALFLFSLQGIASNPGL